MSFFINELQYWIYELEQIITFTLIRQLNDISLYSVILILGGGIATSFNPCTISTIPISVSLINLYQNSTLSIFMYLLGIITSFLGLTLFSLFFKMSMSSITLYFPWIFNVILITGGLTLLNILQFNFTIPLLKKKSELTKNTLISIYILGISIGLNMSPCSTPILVTLIIWIGATKKLIVGINFLIIYIIGYLLPIIISIYYINILKYTPLKYKQWNNIIRIIGSFLLTSGTFTFCQHIFQFI